MTMDEEDLTVQNLYRANKVQQKRIKELEAALEKYRWIPVNKRLPKVPLGPPNASSKTVWLISKGEACQGYYTNYEGWRIYGAYEKAVKYQQDITHWKPIILPEQALKGEQVSVNQKT